MAALKRLTIIRIVSYDGGTYGVFLDGKQPFALTLENTEHQIKEPGIYKCVKARYNRGGYDTYEILVNGRSHILFHLGNKFSDSLGCILVAEEFGVLSGDCAVLSSKQGFAEFLARVDGAEEFELEIREAA